MTFRIWGLVLAALFCTACAGPAISAVSPSPVAGATVPAQDTLQFPSAIAALPAPTRITIPRLELDTQVVPVGLESSGAMAMPQEFDIVGWYNQGAIPGSPGIATLSGHLDSKTGPAIFFTLNKLEPADIIQIELGHGQMMASFRVTRTVTYASDQVPLDRIFGQSDSAHLVLITCAGNFDRKAGAYSERFVVYAESI